MTRLRTRQQSSFTLEGEEERKKILLDNIKKILLILRNSRLDEGKTTHVDADRAEFPWRRR